MGDSGSRQAQLISAAVTLVALTLVVVHLVFPAVKVDAVTIALLIIAIVPWLAPILKTIELPGGWKFEFRELKEKVEQELRDNSRQVQHIAKRVEELAQFAIAGAAPASLKDRLARDLSEYRDHLIALGIDLSGNPPTVAIGDETYENAHYDGAKNEIVAGRPFASSDVLLREYTHHALLEARGQVGLVGSQQDAVESALADYFPCSYRNDPMLGREVAAYYRKRGQAMGEAIRDLETTARLSDVRDRHVHQLTGEIWAAAFWAIRAQLGTEAADRLLLGAWRSTPKGRGAERQFVVAVVDGVNPAQRDAVREAFTTRELPA